MAPQPLVACPVGDAKRRLSLPGADATGAPLAHPAYGDQFQNRGLTGEDPRAHGYGERVLPEGAVYLEWRERDAVYPDGEVTRLRAPRPRFRGSAVRRPRSGAARPSSRAPAAPPVTSRR